ncbi:nicotinamide N-methyltransferase-like [Dendropsophus ebraccatus]|uniref:nicotinamide N-methyltransferase-like n=1 Tax=Dendropsophus ebraccatus TaxID=150705 RepID=UPI0038316D70
MACSTHKHYPVHGYDSRQHLECYFSERPKNIFIDDILIFPIECLTKIFKEGRIKGDVLIDLSAGSLVHHLYSACEFFKHIIVLKVRDRCIMELKRWLDSRTGAFNWGHATKHHVEIEEKSAQVEEKEKKVREAAQHIVKCHPGKENMTDPIVLPPADCVVSVLLLDKSSKDQDDYIRYLKKISKLLKPGGHLILIGCLEMTYYTVGKDKFHAFTYDEEFVRKALAGEGFIIDDFQTKERTNVSDLIDYKSVMFIATHKRE